MAKQGHYFTPIATLVSPELNAKLEALRTRIAADYPDRPPPAIYMLEHGELAEGVPYYPGLNVIPDQIVDSPAAYLHRDWRYWGKEDRILVTEYGLRILTPDELVMTVAHEYGHHYRDHWLRNAQFTTNECEADFFAKAYIPNAGDLLESVARKLIEPIIRRKFPTLPDDAIDSIVTESLKQKISDKQMHPIFADRIALMRRNDAPDIDPRSVQFNSACEVVPPPPQLVPPPASHNNLHH